MSSETTMITKQMQYQSWISMIRESRNRPRDMTLTQWCCDNGITKAAYYWRVSRLKKLCLDSACQDAADSGTPSSQNVPEFAELNCRDEDSHTAYSVTICVGAASIDIPESISDSFLQRIIGAASHAQ